MKYSTLCLGTRGDAATWEKGCRDLGMTCGTSIRSGQPSMTEMEAFFKSQASWLFFGGHFSDGELYNDYDDEAADEGYSTIAGVKFSKEGEIKIASHGKRKTYKKEAIDFNLDMSAKVILWGGCSTLSNAPMVSKLVKLFDGPLAHSLQGSHDHESLLKNAGVVPSGAPTAISANAPPPVTCDFETPLKPASSSKHSTAMLGFKRMTGWRIVDKVLSGKDSFFSNLSGMYADPSEIVQAWLTAAMKAYHRDADMLERFAAIDADGQQWIISGGKAKPGFKV